MNYTAYRIAGGAVLIGLALVVMGFPEDPRKTIGIMVIVASLFLLLLSRVHLGTSFTVRPEARVLVTRGLYSRIQHPLYFFLDTMLLGVIIYFDAPWFLIPWGVLLAIHVFEARREERILRGAFGANYDAYQAHTWF